MSHRATNISYYITNMSHYLTKLSHDINNMLYYVTNKSHCTTSMSHHLTTTSLYITSSVSIFLNPHLQKATCIYINSKQDYCPILLQFLRQQRIIMIQQKTIKWQVNSDGNLGVYMASPAIFLLKLVSVSHVFLSYIGYQIAGDKRTSEECVCHWRHLSGQFPSFSFLKTGGGGGWQRESVCVMYGCELCARGVCVGDYADLK